MPDPVLKTITAGAVPTKVATNVQAGTVKIKKKAGPDGVIKYLETYLLTGETAPTNQSMMISWTERLEINHSQSIDVYIGVVGSENGIVRVDL